jgi:hypothetical protein
MTTSKSLLVLVLFVLSLATASTALASTEGTGWAVSSAAYPTYLKPGGTGDIQDSIVEVGALASHGAITLTDTLPAGVTATRAGGMILGGNAVLTPEEEEKNATLGGARWVCKGNGSGGDVEGATDIEGATVVACTSNPEFLPRIPRRFGERDPEQFVERVGLDVAVAPGATERERPNCATELTLCNRAVVEGGGASVPMSSSDPVGVSASEPGFGFPDWNVFFSNAEGAPVTQAGSHPYAVTFFLGFNELTHEENGSWIAGGEVRDLEAQLPPGFFGDPTAIPRCPRYLFDSAASGGRERHCPVETQIGVDDVEEYNEDGGGDVGVDAQLAVYNVVPPPGVPVEFGFDLGGYRAIFDAGVRSGHGYGIVEHVTNIAPGVKEDQNILTIWGVPAEASHNAQRGYNGVCEQENGCPSGIPVKPFLTLPTSCQQPGEPAPVFKMVGVSTWTNEHVHAEVSAEPHTSEGLPTGFTGCEKLSIEPSLTAAPEASSTDTPTGLTVGVKVPQPTLELPEGLVSATIKNTKVTLPPGIVVNPGQVAGLTACGEVEANVHGEGPATCANSSKVGTIRIKSPLLEDTEEPLLEGNVYVMSSNPPNLELLFTAYGDGIYLKLPAKVHLNESNGQLETTLTETPELPFTKFEASFSGGAQAALVTPTRCGTFNTTSDFTPWTTPIGEDIFPSTSFQISGDCPSGTLPFAPTLTAGSTTDQAGAYTNFSLLLQRGDEQQRIEKLQFKAPAGLIGMISNVTPCPEPQASQGACPESSKIGHTAVASGPGPYPLVVPQPGNEESPIYLTGPYEGAPFGLSILTHVIAGPFDLGNIVTRAKIEVDPHTAQITVTTQPLPQIIDGVPTDLRLIDSVIDRPGFMINPTNCSPQSFSGTAWGAAPPGVSEPQDVAALSSPFGMGSCKELGFTPVFVGSTSGRVTKAGGTSLTLRVQRSSGPGSGQANFSEARISLPKSLPSRLTTLQKACTAAQFNVNPAGCPAASVIGHAVVRTPVLPVPLEGPAYFVSHGGESFPNLDVILQGDGVTIDAVATTFIGSNGVTTVTLKEVPDAPFTSFEFIAPSGPDSVLTGIGNLCAQRLVMPTEFIAQNGLVLKQETPISVTGCAPAIYVTRHSVKGRTATIQVSVPSAGKLTASGEGFSKASKRVGGAGTVTVRVSLTKASGGLLRRVLHKHRGRRLLVSLTFAQKHGAKLKTTTTVFIG